MDNSEAELARWRGETDVRIQELIRRMNDLARYKEVEAEIRESFKQSINTRFEIVSQRLNKIELRIAYFAGAAAAGGSVIGSLIGVVVAKLL